MEHLRIIQLLIRRRTGKLNANEQRDLEQWLNQSGNHRQAEVYEQLWEMSGQYKAGYQPDVEAGLRRLQNRVGSDLPQSRKVLPRRWLWSAAAAVLILALLPALIFWRQLGSRSAVPELVVTQKGEHRDIRLSDGTLVVLNENSRFSYLRNWEGSDIREVELTGEGFFEVAPGENQPFIIHTRYAQVRVVGTAFNVRAYPDESQTEVAVAHGTVIFRSRTGREALTLSARQKGVLEQGDKLYLEKTGNAAVNAQAWQTGALRFRKTPLWQVVRDLDRYFQVEIRLASEKIRNCQINYEPVRLEKMREAIEAIALTVGAEAEQLGERSFRISGGDCSQ